ncbi:MAG: EutN/CcmL family microcompartment protein [Abitibacteriaceae bacterium]|nr:EutN/CcmL family microcompartment protein [Abditibacteriaceae bacterium]MBV9866043.1 EutN/CcmL family microcompartment protein [Abditibacteriaceae bacterium]
MRLGKVVGTVVATQKDPKLVGWKLLLVREMKMDGSLTDTYVVAIDTVGAGIGETVLTVAGSSARLANRAEQVPVDSSVIGIVDSVECDGKRVNI